MEGPNPQALAGAAAFASAQAKKEATVSRRVQVIVTGHPLSPESKRFLREKYGSNIHYFTQVWHTPHFSDAFPATEQFFDRLKDQGANLRGNVTTIFTVPGTSVGAVCIATAWAGLTGELPKFINVIRVGDVWIPSPEMPILDLSSFKNDVYRKRRAEREMLAKMADSGVKARVRR